MGRRKKSDKFTNIFKNSISEAVPTVIPETPEITLNEYLTNYSQNRNLDGIFQKWFMRQDKSNPMKQISEWDELIQKFLNETE